MKQKSDGLEIWGILLNSRGTCIMVDPVLEGFELPLLNDMPIKTEEVPKLDGILMTHSDNDHFSLDTLKKLLPVTESFHAPKYDAELYSKEFHTDAIGHDIHTTFNIEEIKITLTPANHLWQNETSKFDHVFKLEDYCGFWIETTGGTLWIPGDSRKGVFFSVLYFRPISLLDCFKHYK